MAAAKKAGTKAAEKVLSLDDIKAADDLGSETVKCPEWGGVVKVRGLGHGEVVDIFRELDLEVDAAGNLMVPAARAGEYQVALILRGTVEPDFDDDSIQVLREKAAAPVGRVADAISGLSGLGSVENPSAPEAAAREAFLG